MLDYKGFTWDGSIADIDETRCDGVVEYAFDRHPDGGVQRGRMPILSKTASLGSGATSA